MKKLFVFVLSMCLTAHLNSWEEGAEPTYEPNPYPVSAIERRALRYAFAEWYESLARLLASQEERSAPCPVPGQQRQVSVSIQEPNSEVVYGPLPRPKRTLEQKPVWAQRRKVTPQISLSLLPNQGEGWPSPFQSAGNEMQTAIWASFDDKGKNPLYEDS